MAREFWAADCETDPFLHGRMPEPFIFGAYNGDEYHEFRDASEFVDFFYHKKVVVYAHNGGKFDWHFILDHLEPGTKIQVISGRLAKFKIGAAEFRDSYSLLPIPLAAWNKDVFDYRILEKSERDKPKNKLAIRKYLKSDCKNLFEILERFFSEYSRKLTLAGASMAQWRKISGEEPDQSSKRFYDEMKPFYYGGRVECFVKGNKREKFNVYDINSAYPFAMCHKHPWGTLYFTDNRLPKSDDRISRCFITLSMRATGCFPFRNGTELSFPSDHASRVFNITGWEFLAARDTGTLDAGFRIIEVREFQDTMEFSEYVNHFYELKAKAKKDGDKAQYIFAKLFMNSLYGKFASNPGEYSEYMTVLPDEIEAHSAPELGGWHLVCELHNVAIVSRKLPEESQRFFNVAVGASITGFVRAHLWRAICASGSVLYCDTDSVATRGKKPGAMGESLGEWSHEGEFKEWAIAGKKLYAFYPADGAPKIASKGVKLSASEIKAIARGAEIEYKQDAPTFGLRGKRFNVRKVRAT